MKLLNIGTEELKGTDELKEAAALLREADYLPFRFDGFTEGDQLSRGDARRRRHRRLLRQHRAQDRRGNRAVRHRPLAPRVQELASLEGRVRACRQPALNLLKVHLDPNNHNGAVFLGLNGLVVKSHGSANPKGVANAIGVAASMVRNDITRKIGDDLDNFRAHAFANGSCASEPALGRPRSRLGACQAAGSSNEELAETVDTSDAVDRRADRNPQPLHRRRRRDDGEPRDRRRAPRARPCRASTATDIDLIVLATATPDQTFPSSATKVQAALGIDDCVAFDVHAVCTGFLYALSVADSMLRSGNAHKALVIGSETFSRILDWEDRATCVLFGDGAGALVLGAEESESGILATRLHADGRHNDLLFVDGGPSTTGTVGKLRMKGREVFRHAVVNLADVLNEVLEAAGLTRRGRRLGRAAPGQCANPRRDRAKARPSAGEGRRHRRRACQYVGGVGSAGVRYGRQGRANQARRP